MSNTIAGLLGGVIGALISALAMFLGPLAHQRQIARQERARADREATQVQLQRVARARTAIRVWHDFLRRALTDLEAGRALDAERFLAQADAMRDEARAASDDLLGGGLWIGSQQFGAFVQVTEVLRNHHAGHADADGRALLVEDDLGGRVALGWKDDLYNSRAGLNEELLTYVEHLRDTPVEVIDTGTPVRPRRS
ncbi:hypothetical protein EAO75_37150 [Streptomyces sp. uw30]|uniref:hypothetical protein n=1 Tax=Streptomyces sp. uw30 TaxID=1828179 RepID=UPI0011CEA1E8|nr:hypothetical protein [Streptomyces sp. uw30]TXS40574.1 hypothetical protein EAO75_37150 [Streptomyces sp. uw30]